MSTIALPAGLETLRLEPLMAMTLIVAPPIRFGAGPGGERRVGVVTGGRFEGDRFAGHVLDGGADWQLRRSDGAWLIDCRLVLQTDDGAIVGMQYSGLRHGPGDVMDRLAQGDPVDPSEYYFRITPTFETADPRYAWLNQLVGVGAGHRPPSGPVYKVWSVV
ncbi:MAG: DUF3237 domain-containing protein [Phenylobacterium sp.]|uniref:DUF3237 domain-containing protein n=1 Tax=Phenylobacterium sp. TaxID=1871053 RepID=UPI001208E166|nr:DUF3237 domain-containing protein [Phenylobacterium sp.]TAJ72805.1 MAG: DUF3237 domain-containing protein [Phenylobacterium sp.]